MFFDYVAMFEWEWMSGFTIFLYMYLRTVFIKISQNMFKLVEVDRNLWFFILKVTLISTFSYSYPWSSSWSCQWRTYAPRIGIWIIYLNRIQRTPTFTTSNGPDSAFECNNSSLKPTWNITCMRVWKLISTS